MANGKANFQRLMRLPLLAATLAGGCGEQNSCVARGSRVATPRGVRPIEELRVGDDIYSVDVDRCELVATTVIAVRSAERECASVKLMDGTRLLLTTDHPVFDPEACVYAPAGDWVLGRRKSLLVVDGNEPTRATVGAVEVFAGIHRVFDITVESVHHNFVAEGVVVHNKTFRPPCEGSYENCDCWDGTSSVTSCHQVDGGWQAVCACPEGPPIDPNDAGQSNEGDAAIVDSGTDPDAGR